MEFTHEVSSSQGGNESVASSGDPSGHSVRSVSKVLAAPSRTLMGSGPASHLVGQVPLQPQPCQQPVADESILFPRLRPSFLIYETEDDHSIYLMAYLRLNEIVHVSIRMHVSIRKHV